MRRAHLWQNFWLHEVWCLFQWILCLVLYLWRCCQVTKTHWSILTNHVSRFWTVNEDDILYNYNNSFSTQYYLVSMISSTWKKHLHGWGVKCALVKNQNYNTKLHVEHHISPQNWIKFQKYISQNCFYYNWLKQQHSGTLSTGYD